MSSDDWDMQGDGMFKALQMEFKRHCIDYMEPLGDKKSQALEFCGKILYEVGPKSRKVKEGTWKFDFINPENDQQHCVFVTKLGTAELKIEDKSHHMKLTLKQAALLAHETFARLIMTLDSKQYMLTPLAGAVFSKYDVEKLALDLNETQINVVLKMNQSTQSGGQVLKYGDPDFAIAAAIFTTRNLKDKNIKESIVNNTVKQYRRQNKMPNEDRIGIIAKYTTGGIPVELTRIFDFIL